MKRKFATFVFLAGLLAATLLWPNGKGVQPIPSAQCQDLPKTNCSVVKSVCWDVANGLQELCEAIPGNNTTQCGRDALNFYWNCVTGEGC